MPVPTTTRSLSIARVFAVAACALTAGCGTALPAASPGSPFGTALGGTTLAGGKRLASSSLLDIGPRYQWEHNYGYCGEVSFISAGLYYGQYVSQYDARAAATDAPQYDYRSQLLLGGTDARAARNMHLAMTEWDRRTEKSPHQFLAWVEQNVLSGYPVAIGIYTNDYRFYGDRNPKAGSSAYDHIVPVLGIDAHGHGRGYDPDDKITFSDNGLHGPGPQNSHYTYTYRFGSFIRTRKAANGPDVPWYSLPDRKENFGAAITGVMDNDHETVPVRVVTSANDETPQIAKHSDVRPPADKLVLTVTVSGLQSGSRYALYRYDSLSAIPDGAFNAYAGAASKVWNFTAGSSGTYVVTEHIMTDDVAAYRAVPVGAP
ncbi:MAG TPA: hypothetical protein VGF18_05035 [Candidatus Tumulicola sp.]|jgi:hypothetical protein